MDYTVGMVEVRLSLGAVIARMHLGIQRQYLGDIAVEQYSMSNTSSNIQAPISKAGSTTIRNNPNRPHPHKDCQKTIIADPLKEGYK
nr:hypothetical protein CFP56_15666 [Quercus suber]